MTLWMLYAVLFGALALAGGLALERGARLVRLPGRFAWLTMLVIAVGAPLALPSIPRERPSIESAAVVTGTSASIGAATALATQRSWQDRMPDLDRPLAWLWIVLSAVCLGRFAIGMASLRRRRAQWAVREIVGTQCYVTPDIGPAVVTMPETRIVVPEWVLSLDPDSLATVICHERQHKIARDGWLIVTGAVATALMPWNPAAWIIQRRLRLAIEMDCDARVLGEEPRVDRYGSLLLAIAQRPRLIAGLGATLTESTSDLERRIDAMTARPPRNPRTRALILAAAGVAAIAVACGMPAPDMVGGPRGVNPTETATQRPGAYFDFQVEKPASAQPSNLPPRYPDQLRAAGIQGAVLTKFVVDTTGHADMASFHVIKSDHEGFTTAVREALPDMRFFPAEVGGKKVKQLIQMPFSFSLVRGERPEAMASVGKAVVSREPKVVFEMRNVDPATRKATSRSGFSLSVDSVPQLIDGAPPTYPNQLRAANIEGMVQAKFEIRPDGRADMNTFTVMRSDHELFTAAVRKAVEKMRFRPAMVNGKAVSMLQTMPFMFSLKR
jgi:TonB family protein